MARRRLQVMVSSSVHGFEDQLGQIDAILTNYGYNVVISAMGTVRVGVHLHNFEACQQAVEGCDIFMGIIRGRYGSGQASRTGLADTEISITHLEVRHAVRCKKPRLFLVEAQVDMARQLLRNIRTYLKQDVFDAQAQPVWKSDTNLFRQNPILDDLRVLDMYDEALQSGTPLLERRDHWCQTYRSLPDIERFLDTQFRDRKRLAADLRTALALVDESEVQ